MKEYIKDLKEKDILGIGMYFTLLSVFIIGIIYWGYISGEPHRVVELLHEEFSGFMTIFYFTMIGMGLGLFSIIWYGIAELFYPNTESDLKLKKKRKEYYKTYPSKIAHLKYKELKKEQQLIYIKEKLISLFKEVKK